VATKTEDGVAFEQGDYCYTPDPDVPSGWKLRITDTPGGKPDPAIVGAAAAALSPGGFRGNPVDIPAADRAAVVACVRRAWREANPDKAPAEMPDSLQTREGDADLHTAEPPVVEVQTADLPTEIEIRDLAKREIVLRIVPWGVLAQTQQGLEMFERGAFDGTVPGDVVLRMAHTDPPAGRGLWLEQRQDAAYMGFKVSRTQRGDEILALAADGVTRGASVGFAEVPGGTLMERSAGVATRRHRRVNLREVSTTWQPAYADAGVMEVRSAQEGTPMADGATAPDPQAAPAPAAAPATATLDLQPLNTAIDSIAQRFDSMATRLEQMEERQRSAIILPSIQNTQRPQPVDTGKWLQTALRLLSGERVPDLQLRELADLIVADNAGVVPDAFQTELIGEIDPNRPFLQTTRRLNTPQAGMSMVVPRIVTRPTVGIQVAEKDELTSTATEIDTASFDAVTKGGAGDISLQLLKRSDPSFLDLYLRLLAEAYAIDSEQEAVEALLSDDVTPGGTLDPEDLSLGQAWKNGATNTGLRRAPDTIWLSSEAVADFIDAKANGTNAPLYTQLQANFSAGNGVGGNISGLRAVYTPALDSTAVDVLVGPSRGFAWAEDGTFTLQVDVPAKAGRDVALVGILWFAPLYPAAFTTFTLA
jgi:HK97 family phage prohead protease/HK97 family phage major capsid protein